MLPLYTNVFSGWLDYPEYFFIWCYHGKNSIFNTMSYQSKDMDGFIDGAVTAAADRRQGDLREGREGLCRPRLRRHAAHPALSALSNVAMQKNVSGYQYWFHRRLDYRALVKGVSIARECLKGRHRCRA